jgi:zinc protease
MKKFNSYILVLVVTLLAACTMPIPTVDRSKAPLPGPAPVLQIGQYQMFELENGLKVVVVENHKLPRVSYNINLDIDPIVEGSKAGYVSMAGDLLGAGTTSKSKAQIDESVDFLGASLNTGASGVFGSCLSKHRGDFLAIMSDVLLNPSFSAEELEKLRKKTLSGMASDKTDPNTISGKITNLKKYGASHPYGETMSEETVKAITRDDVAGYYSKYFRPNSAYLIIVGDITLEQAKADANTYFAAWKKGEVPTHAYPTPKEPTANKVVFVPLAGAVQSVIDITYPIELKPGTQDAIVAGVLNNVLGGSGFQTRLMQNLREDKAYTYGAYSEISSDEVIGQFSAGASVRNEVTDSAIVQFIYEMERLVKEPIADSTLQLIKNIMTGSFARSLERPQTVANFALNIERYKLPKDYYETYLQKLNAVTAADVQAMAKRVIRPNNAYITVVGNREIMDKLKVFSADGKVEVLDADGKAFVEMQPAPAGMTANDVLKKYIAAIGGEAKLKSVTSYDHQGVMEMMGMQANTVEQMETKGHRRTEVSLPGMPLYKAIYNEGKSVMIEMGTAPREFDADELMNARRECDLLAELHLSDYGITSTLLGVDYIKGEDCYVIEMKETGGEVRTVFFSVANGLMILEREVKDMKGQAMTEETSYENYQEVDGIKYPALRTTNAGGQSFVIRINKAQYNVAIPAEQFNVNQK